MLWWGGESMESSRGKPLVTSAAGTAGTAGAAGTAQQAPTCRSFSLRSRSLASSRARCCCSASSSASRAASSAEPERAGRWGASSTHVHQCETSTEGCRGSWWPANWAASSVERLRAIGWELMPASKPIDSSASKKQRLRAD